MTIKCHVKQLQLCVIMAVSGDGFNLQTQQQQQVEKLTTFLLTINNLLTTNQEFSTQSCFQTLRASLYTK